MFAGSFLWHWHQLLPSCTAEAPEDALLGGFRHSLQTAIGQRIVRNILQCMSASPSKKHMHAMHVYLGTTWHNKCNLFRTERFKADTSSKPTVNGCLGLLQTKDSLQSAVVRMQIQTWLYSSYPGSKVLVDGIDHSRSEVFAGQASWLNKFIVKKCSEKPKKPKFEFYFCAFCCTLRPSHHIDH